MATTTFFPDPNVESTSVDGVAISLIAQNTFATVRAASGTAATDINTNNTFGRLQAGTITDQYVEIRRSFLLFDTSALPDTDTIDSATCSVVGQGKSDGMSLSLSLVASTPASNTAIAASDYQGTVSNVTKFATDITIASFDVSGTVYTDWNLNASGLAAISKTAVTKLGGKIANDADNVAPTWSSGADAYLNFLSAETAGTTTDPKLVVVHSSTVNSHSLDLEFTSSQYAEIADASQTGLDITGDFTIECWTKPETIAGDTMLASKLLSGNQRSYYFQVLSTGKLRAAYYSDGTSTFSYSDTDNVVVSNGTWAHVAVAVDVSAASFTFYVDGVAVADTVVSSAATTVFSGTAPFTIGSSGDHTTYYDGLIEEVRVWDDIRTAQEIVDNAYTELVGNEANLQGYWKLNNDYTDETSNGNDLTASGSPVFSTVVPWTTTNSKSLDLESSSSQYASITDASQTGLDITGDMTIECWFKPESDLNFTHELVAKWLEASNRSYRFYYDDSANALKFNVSSDGITAESLTVSQTLTIGTWYHVAVAWDASASSAEFFVNGLSIGSNAGAVTAAHSGTGAVAIGCRDVGGTPKGFVDGLVDEVRVWDTIRTADQIAAAMDIAIKSDHANLQACYALDDDYLDETSNNNDLTATGAPVFSTDVPTWPYVAPAAASTISHNMYIIL